MDCTELYEEAHVALRLATITARGGARKLQKDALAVLESDMNVRDVLRDLEDEGHIAVSQSIIQVLDGCKHKQLVDKNGPSYSFPTLSRHIEEGSQAMERDMAERSEGRVHNPPKGVGYELSVTTEDSHLSTSRYIDNWGFRTDMIDADAEVDMEDRVATIRKRRIQRRVDSRKGRGYRERPVETWTPANLVAYWDAETLTQLWGISPDRTNAGALSAAFADLIAEGTPPATVRDMIDRFIQQTKSNGRKVPSLWKRFLKSKSEIYQQTLDPRSTKKFNRTDEGDGRVW